MIFLFEASEGAPTLAYDFSPDPEAATIYIYREWKFVAGGVDLLGYLNDRPIGEYDNGTFLKISTKPGIHDIWSDMGPHNMLIRSHMELILEKGKNYFIGVSLGLGVSELSNIFYEMDPIEAQTLIAEMAAK